MLTEAYKQNVSVSSEGGKNLPSLAKYFTLKIITIAIQELLVIYPGVEEWEKCLYVAINTLLHKV